MIQTRGQTRNGAPPPSIVEPFSTAIGNNTINNPPKRRRVRPTVRESEDKTSEPSHEELPQQDEHSNAAEAPETDEHLNLSGNNSARGTSEVPPAPRISPTLNGVCRAEEDILRDIVSYITGLDLHNLILALPLFRRLLRASNAPQPLACQDCPVMPMLKHRDPPFSNLLAFEQAPLPQPMRCTTPATALVPLKRCEGHALRYTEQDEKLDHGPDFWVCQHCVQKAWEAYSMFVKSRGIDLCYMCSRNHRIRNGPPVRPPNYPRQCTCLWDDKLWLCRTCRISKSTEDRTYALDWIQAQQNFVPMHVAQGRGTHPRDFIDSDSRDGESYCPCGLDVRGKLRSYDNFFDESAPPNFRPLVRLCLYCRRERFLTNSRLD